MEKKMIKLIYISLFTSMLFANNIEKTNNEKDNKIKEENHSYEINNKSELLLEKTIVNDKDLFPKKNENEFKIIPKDELDKNFKKEDIKENEAEKSELDTKVKIDENNKILSKQEIEEKIKIINEAILKINETLKRIEESNNKNK